MKNIFKKLYMKASTGLILMISLSSKALLAASSENFNFIKSQGNSSDFLYDGSLLLYGGIILVILSVLGTIFTFVPRKNKKIKKRR